MTERAQAAPKASDAKKLFSLSGNRCAFPRCRNTIIVGGRVVGEIAHIHAASPGGPRYLASQTPAERHGFDNLILMCPIHHSVVDDDWETYTAERLRRMKIDHEDHATPVTADEASSGGSCC